MPDAVARIESRFDVTTWYLEMRSPPSRAPASPAGASLARLTQPTTHFYRYLYETVGAPWLWVERRRMPDEELLVTIQDPDVSVVVAYFGGAPAGYYELDARTPGQVELSYFGLVPDLIGKGLGRWLIESAVAHAWSIEGTTRLWVHTCSLDHPRARANYERAGFVLYESRSESVWDPRPLPISPR